MNLEGFPILTLVTFLPLVGAILVAVLPRTAARPVALGAALVTWVASLLLLIGYSAPEAGGFQYQEVHDWIPLFGIQYKLGVDGLSLLLVVLTTTLTWISMPWDAQFYPDGIKGWMAKIDAEPTGGISFDPNFLVEFEDGLRPHQVRLQGGDASSDSFCYAE
jgi:NADH:ubiquinone oxidoreductase subunit 4 (subunit M)